MVVGSWMDETGRKRDGCGGVGKEICQGLSDSTRQRVSARGSRGAEGGRVPGVMCSVVEEASACQDEQQSCRYETSQLPHYHQTGFSFPNQPRAQR